MMTDKKSLTVTILGKSYSIVTDEDSQLIEDAAAYIDSQLKRTASQASPPVEVVKKTTFVALQLAVELQKIRQELEAKSKELEIIGGKTTTLNELLRESMTH